MVLVYLEKKAWGREQRGRGSLLQGSPLHRQPVCLGVLQHIKGQGSGVGISPQPAATSSAECTFLRAARGWGQRGRLCGCSTAQKGTARLGSLKSQKYRNLYEID